VSICGTSITGPVSISGATAPVLFGEPATGDCAGNQIVAPVRIDGETEGTDFPGNTVTGRVVLTNNVGGLVFGDLAANTIVGPVATSGNV
jgi:hypothetical protein